MVINKEHEALMVFKINNDSKYQRSPNVLYREVKGETFLIPTSTASMSAKEDAVFTLTDSAKMIWDLLDGTNTVKQVIGHLQQHFDVPESQVKQDVVEFLESLARFDMINQV